MRKTGFDRVWGGMFRYQILVPSHGLCWDEEIEAASDFVANVKPAYLRVPWLIDPIVRFNEPMKFKIPPSFQPAELLRRFARLPLTRPAIGAFANEFGFLGKALLVRHPIGTNRSENTLKLGESFYFWKEEIERMRFLLDIWDAIQMAKIGGDLGLLTQCIVWNNPGKPLYVRIDWPLPEKKQSTMIAAEWLLPQNEMLRQWKHNDRINPAYYYLKQQIESQLKGHVELIFSDDNMYIKFDCLLAALYSAFEWEVLGKGYAPTQCPQCGKIFTPARSNQKYHNKNCQKNAAWHRNQERWRKQPPKDGVSS